jgi:MFS family permease
MDTSQEVKGKEKKFAGMTVPADLTRMNFFNLYLCTFFMGCLMTFPAIIQPALLKNVIGIPPENAGSLNSALQNMSQIATLLFIGFIGYLSDKHGRRILAILGFVVCAIFYLLFGFTKDISLAMGLTDVNGQVAVAFVIRFVIGIGLILGFPQFITMVADYTLDSPWDRGKGMALNGICMGLAAMVTFGAFAQIAKKTGLSSVFYMAAIMSVLGIIVSRFGLVDRMPKEKAEKKSFKEIWQIVTKSMPLKACYFATFVSRADIVVMATLLVVWMVNSADKHGLTAMQATARGGINMIVLSLVSFVAFPIIGVLLDRWGRVPVLILSLIFAGVGFSLIATLSDPFSKVTLIYMALCGIGLSGAVVGANTLAVDGSPPGMIGTILGGLNTMQPVGILLFLQVGGLLFDKVGPGSAFLLKGLADLIVGIWIFSVRGKIKSEV